MLIPIVEENFKDHYNRRKCWRKDYQLTTWNAEEKPLNRSSLELTDWLIRRDSGSALEDARSNRACDV